MRQHGIIMSVTVKDRQVEKEQPHWGSSMIVHLESTGSVHDAGLSP